MSINFTKINPDITINNMPPRKMKSSENGGEASNPSSPDQLNKPLASDRVQRSSLLDYLLKLLFDLQQNTKNPDQGAIAKILKVIQNLAVGDPPFFHFG